WNPNRLEQRFGRIHRIGQTEICHLWNLVAGETREGYVYERLLRKLETESKALNGQVFDILGDLFTETPLRQLLIEAILYGEQPQKRAYLEQALDNALDREHVRKLLEAQSLAADSMDLSQIEEIRADMERYQALRLQPHHVQAFFLEAFSHLGGTITRREPGRWRISYVPAAIRERARETGTAVPIHTQYERVTFDKALINPPGEVLADFLCPGHPLLDTVVDLVLDRYRNLLSSGAVLVDETDPGQEPRTLFFLEQRLRDASQRVISQEVHFVEISAGGSVGGGGFAPYLNYRPLADDEREKVAGLADAFESGEEAADRAAEHAILELVPRHLQRVRERREKLIEKTERAVQKRLTAEINHWDRQARLYRRQAEEGKPNARLNADKAQRRADDLARRRQARMDQLALEKQIAPDPPVIIGGALIVPIGLLRGEQTPADLVDTRVTEQAAMRAVYQAEVALGNHPRDVSAEKLGYDIESLDPQSGHTRFIEVKGRRPGADAVTVTTNEIMCCINTPQHFILALVEVDNGQAAGPRYVRAPFEREPDFHVTSVNYHLQELLEKSEEPH
ncbi:MAG: protein NO VEIN domain-containing protein, partial [Candidatus Promineifilaceae bacterium]